MRQRITRRQFLRATAGAGAGVLVLSNPLSARTYAANEAVNLALVGVAGRGLWFSDNLLPRMKGVNLAVLCDVDEYKAKAIFEKYADRPKYNDFRVMLDKSGKDIDAVIVAVPDNTHAVATAAALRAGKPCFTEKPLTHDVYESHVLRLLAAERKLPTQMGNQGTSSPGFRRALELIRGGTLGTVQEVYIWCVGGGGRSGVNWVEVPCPETLHWDLWLGPAKYRPYHPAWLRFGGWRDFGTAALGNWGCHSGNLPFMALYAHTLWHADPAEQPRIRFRGAAPSDAQPGRWPSWWTCRWELPARQGLPPVPFTWVITGAPEYKQMQEKMLSFGVELNEQGVAGTHTGCFIVGTEGALVSSSHNTGFKLYPQAKFQDYQGPEPSIARSPGHEREWIDAIKGGPAPFSNFDYAGPLNELLQLGNVANQLPDQDLEYDPLNCKIVNNPEADALLRRQYREGWTL